MALSMILLGLVSVCIFFLFTWLFERKPQKFKAHMLFKELSNEEISKKNDKKKKDRKPISNQSIFDVVLLNIKPLKKFAPAIVIREAEKFEWDLKLRTYYFIYFASSVSFSLALYIYLNKNLVSLAGFILGIFIPRIVLYYKEKAYAHSLNNRLSVYMKTMANSISVLGNVVDALNDTIKLVHPSLKPDLLKVVSLLQSGKSVTYAYKELCDKYDFNDFKFFHEMLEVTHDTGGEYTDVLLNIAEDFEQRKILQAKLDTALSQAKKAYILNCGIFAALPFVFYYFQNPAYRMLMTTAFGPAVLIFFSVILILVYYKIEQMSQFKNFKNQ